MSFHISISDLHAQPQFLKYLLSQLDVMEPVEYKISNCPTGVQTIIITNVTYKIIWGAFLYYEIYF